MEKQLYYFQTYGELYVIEYEIRIKIKIVSERYKPPLRIVQTTRELFKRRRIKNASLLQQRNKLKTEKIRNVCH